METATAEPAGTSTPEARLFESVQANKSLRLQLAEQERRCKYQVANLQGQVRAARPLAWTDWAGLQLEGDEGPRTLRRRLLLSLTTPSPPPLHTAGTVQKGRRPAVAAGRGAG
jgi:hypothetical protein